jgi:uncharacterized membrane protein (TIGR02234 family)
MTQHKAARPNVGTGRTYAVVLLVGLLSAAAVAVGVTRPWYEAFATGKNLPRLQAAATGADLMPLAGALGVVLLGSFGAVVATRGAVRRALGVLIVVCSIVVLGAAAHPGSAAQVLTDGLSARGWSGGSYLTAGRPWRWLVLVGAAGCLVAGAAVACFGARWPTLGQRYGAPAPVADPTAVGAGSRTGGDDDVTDEQLWRALDRGDDPTQTS